MAERDPVTGRWPKGSGMPATGRGWGGPAKGITSPTRPPGPGRPRGVRNGKGKRVRIRERLAAVSDDLAARWIDIALDPTHPHSHTMVIKAAEALGEFEPSLTLRAESDAVVFERRIVDPLEPQALPEPDAQPQE